MTGERILRTMSLCLLAPFAQGCVGGDGDSGDLTGTWDVTWEYGGTFDYTTVVPGSQLDDTCGLTGSVTWTVTLEETVGSEGGVYWTGVGPDPACDDFDASIWTDDEITYLQLSADFQCNPGPEPGPVKQLRASTQNIGGSNSHGAPGYFVDRANVCAQSVFVVMTRRGSSGDDGDEGGACYGNGTCNGMLSCKLELCVDLGIGTGGTMGYTYTPPTGPVISGTGGTMAGTGSTMAGTGSVMAGTGSTMAGTGGTMPGTGSVMAGGGCPAPLVCADPGSGMPLCTMDGLPPSCTVGGSECDAFAGTMCVEAGGLGSICVRSCTL